MVPTEAENFIADLEVNAKTGILACGMSWYLHWSVGDNWRTAQAVGKEVGFLGPSPHSLET